MQVHSFCRFYLPYAFMASLSIITSNYPYKQWKLWEELGLLNTQGARAELEGQPNFNAAHCPR